MMLRGHESLLRLVGKRRKLHPSVFITPVSEDVQLDDKVNVRNVSSYLLCSSTSLADIDSDVGRQQDALPSVSVKGSPSAMQDSGKENCSPDWVNCPVCSKSIKGNDINSHLGREP